MSNIFDTTVDTQQSSTALSLFEDLGWLAKDIYERRQPLTRPSIRNSTAITEVVEKGHTCPPETAEEAPSELQRSDWASQLTKAVTSFSSEVASSTALPVGAIRNVLRLLRQEARVQLMSPEHRALYRQILKLREEIGYLEGFDALQVLREIRGR